MEEQVKVKLILNGETKHILWDKEMSLLHALYNAGIRAPYSCSRGMCGKCACKLERGEVHLKRNFVLSESHLDQRIILTCVATPVSNDIEINYDSL